MKTDETTAVAPGMKGKAGSVSNEAVRPFQYHASQEDLDDLKRRILATRWPQKETVNDQSQGPRLATLKALADYWGNKYDWRKVEAKLDAWPQFITEIDGLDIHFIHVRSKHENAKPIIVTHGWPGSIIEQLKIIGPLTDPTAHGGKAEDAFHVVIPSIPGYGFSGKPTTTGWGPARIAAAFVTLMKRLGYEKFFAQGGDWGALITDLMAVQSPENVLGMATNFPIGTPAELEKAAFGGASAPPNLTAEEKIAYDELKTFTSTFPLQILFSIHPQSMLGTADSPISLATMFLNHDQPSMAMISRIFAGQTEGLTKDDILDNITLTWLTNTAISGCQIYWENKYDFFSAQGVKVPVVVSAFPDEVFHAPKHWVEQAYPKMVYYKKHNMGGHFAAWEQPALLVQDLREGFRSLR
ncbi:epoxide hydrolase family protein [Flavihumibacter solisilvae]|uniref:Multidrug MFS transporter n=1 Tax=Flavihumibacter solisilvae TaxID=1349421 RepID=A0A0C1IER8_9BACT|nr:epoxide hydrolase [Flavihumibacter solisilvae]KIC92660.1 multidrug MFS transporter [Flavihumibacter solisilvae]